MNKGGQAIEPILPNEPKYQIFPMAFIHKII
jgi:hypothetical protein